MPVPPLVHLPDLHLDRAPVVPQQPIPLNPIRIG